MAAMRVRMNEAITEESVLLYGDDGTLAEVSLEDALRLARTRSMDLVEEHERPRVLRGGAVVCRLLRLQRPVVWEGAAAGRSERTDEPPLDPELWFHTDHCEGRHYLVGNPHTFPGRLAAWCPSKRIGFCVSKSEIAECSRETSYYLKGFLAGQEPAPPVSDEGDPLPPDDPEDRAWARAAELFQRTGSWNARFRICEVCGARLLPSNTKSTCEHAHVPR
jgi:hypothetical protein